MQLPFIQEQLLKLAEEFETPLYVYNSSVMQNQLKKMQKAFDFPHRVHFSCKSLTNPAILQLFKSLGCGLDTASYEQVLLGLESGFPPEDILFTPSGTSFERICKVSELGVTVNFDNIEQLELYAQQYPERQVFLRFNPDIIAGGSANVSVGHSESKFGIHMSQLPYLLKVIETFNIQVLGVHVHTGSDILDINRFVESSQLLLNLCKHFKPLKFVNLGSGFKVKYRNNDLETDLEQLGSSLKVELQKINKNLNKELTIIVEPGKFLVSESGVLLTKVNLVKQTPTASFVFVNSGFNHLIRPMYYNSYHEIKNLSNSDEKMKVYHIVGYLGETDTFGWNRKLANVETNDILAILNAGAYGYSMSSNYNFRPRPAEILIHEENIYEITVRESYDHLKKLYQSFSFEFSDT